MRRSTSRLIILLLLLAMFISPAFGCGGNIEESEPPKSVTSSESAAGFTVILTVTPEVTAPGKNFNLVLKVENRSGEDKDFYFLSSQKYNFTARDSEGKEVWQWSADMKFTQASTFQKIKAAGVVSFEESWDTLSELQGDFQVTGYYLGLEDLRPSVEVKITAGKVI